MTDALVFSPEKRNPTFAFREFFRLHNPFLPQTIESFCFGGYLSSFCCVLHNNLSDN